MPLVGPTKLHEQLLLWLTQHAEQSLPSADVFCTWHAVRGAADQAGRSSPHMALAHDK